VGAQFSDLEYKIPPEVARAALLRLFRGGEDPIGGQFQPLAGLWSEADLTSINQHFLECADTFELSETSYDVFEGGMVFQIHGWQCDGVRCTFRKIFTLPTSRRFRLEGVFVQASGGEWKAQPTRLARLLSRTQALSSADGSERRARSIELIPTLEEAKAALEHWLRDLDRSHASWGWDPRLEDLVKRYLRSHECRDALARAEVIEDKDSYLIGDWTLWLHDLSFVKPNPVERPYRPKTLRGHFRMAPSGQWHAVPESIVFY
jgi:hypothetical protein